MKENSGVICQSCGMPIRSSEDYGSDYWGLRSFEYCYQCSSGGKFTDEGITMDEKIEKSVSIAIKYGMTENDARIMLKEVIPQLTRWQKRNYKAER